VSFPSPDHDEYADARSRQVELAVSGGTTTVLVYEPADAGPRPAVVIGAEGGGINHFVRRIASGLAHVGLVALVPDYYRGVTMADPDDYGDVEGMIRMIAALDFRRAAHDFLATIELARQLPSANGKVAAWGYCTGGTIAMFGTCLDRKLDAAVLYYPSQPRFEALDAQHPANVVDLVWNIACPVLIVYGDQDEVMSPEERENLRGRLTQWGVDHEIKLYAGAHHAFSSPGYAYYDVAAADAAWQDGLAFTLAKMGEGRWLPQGGIGS
jgi:carboxymethylenebutenolidase